MGSPQEFDIEATTEQLTSMIQVLDVAGFGSRKEGRQCARAAERMEAALAAWPVGPGKGPEEWAPGGGRFVRFSIENVEAMVAAYGRITEPVPGTKVSNLNLKGLRILEPFVERLEAAAAGKQSRGVLAIDEPAAAEPDSN